MKKKLISIPNLPNFNPDQVMPDKCDFKDCGEVAVAKFNGKYCCLQHFDLEIGNSFKPLRRALKIMSGE